MTRISGDTTDPADASAWERMYREKAVAELAQADSLLHGVAVVAWSGDVCAEVLLVKGEPGPSEVAGGAALSGPDGPAAAKALSALGFDPASIFATVAWPEPGLEAPRVAERIRMQVEAIDPYAVIAMGPSAADVVRAAFSLGALAPGRPLESGGRVFLAVDDLEASLADPDRKRRVWQQFKTVRPRQPVW